MKMQSLLLGFLFISTTIFANNDSTLSKTYLASIFGEKYIDTIKIIKGNWIESLQSFEQVSRNGNLSKVKKGEKILIAIISPKSNKKYIVHDSAFFDTPIWEEKKLPIQIVKRNTKKYLDYKKEIPELQGDGIEIFTEAGIWTLLFWNKTKIDLYEPAEEP